MPTLIPIIATPNQTMTIPLSGQPCRINVYQKSTGLYVDLYVNDALIIAGIVALNRVKIVRDAYLGFVGDLAFYDTQGDQWGNPQDPDYTGLGTRWLLYYFSPAEL